MDWDNTKTFFKWFFWWLPRFWKKIRGRKD